VADVGRVVVRRHRQRHSRLRDPPGGRYFRPCLCDRCERQPFAIARQIEGVAASRRKPVGMSGIESLARGHQRRDGGRRRGVHPGKRRRGWGAVEEGSGACRIGQQRQTRVRCLIELPHQFPDADAGAELYLRRPNLQIPIIALAGVGLQGGGFVAELGRFIDSSALLNGNAHLLIADKRAR
jgi:hypothetical protein